jgi:hypothetical protein
MPSAARIGPVEAAERTQQFAMLIFLGVIALLFAVLMHWDYLCRRAKWARAQLDAWWHPMPQLREPAAPARSAADDLEELLREPSKVGKGGKKSGGSDHGALRKRKGGAGGGQHQHQHQHQQHQHQQQRAAPAPAAAPQAEEWGQARAEEEEVDESEPWEVVGGVGARERGDSTASSVDSQPPGLLGERSRQADRFARKDGDGS